MALMIKKNLNHQMELFFGSLKRSEKSLTWTQMGLNPDLQIVSQSQRAASHSITPHFYQLTDQILEDLLSPCLSLVPSHFI